MSDEKTPNGTLTAEEQLKQLYQSLTSFPQDFDAESREYYAAIAEFFGQTAAETIESLQEETAIREIELSDGRKIAVGPRKIQEMIAYLESRSGTIADTDDQGIVQFPKVCFPEKGRRRGTVRRSRFYTGFSVKAITMDSAAKSADLRQRGGEPKDIEIKGRFIGLAKDAGEEAQRKGDVIDRKIINENYEYRPPYIQAPIIQSIRLEHDVKLDTDLIGRLTSAAYAYIREKGGRGIDQVKVQLARFTEHNVVARSSGTLVDQLIPATSLVVYVKTVNGSEAFGAIRGSCGTMEQVLRRYRSEGDTTDLFEIVRNLCDQVLREGTDLDRAEGAAILGSRAPVILSPQVAGVFAHECFGHPAEGDIIVDNFRDQSAQIKLKSRLGAQVSEHPRLTVIESPHPYLIVDGKVIHRFNWGSFVVDHYGELAKVCTIVESGIMVEAMTDLLTHEYVVSGMKDPVLSRMKARGLSGSSRGENYSAGPQIRMRNTFILPDPDGPSTKEEMAAKYPEFKVKKGVYIKSCKGGWVDTRNGTFAIEGNLGYLIENGTVTDKPIKNVTVTGKLQDLPGMIGGIGNAKSMHHTFTGFCGKNGQWVRVDGAGPLLYLKEAQIGGGSVRGWMEFMEDYASKLEEAKNRKRAMKQVVVPEISSHRRPEEPEQRICCVLTAILPFGIMSKVLAGERRQNTTHELIWDPNLNEHRLVERTDPHGL
jgi:predicted Zn-dependent protease